MHLLYYIILYTTQWRHIDTFVSVTSAVLTMFNRRARSLLTNTACDRVQNRFSYSVSCIYGTIFDPYLPRFDDWGQSLFKGRGVVSFSVQNPSAGENSPHFHPSTSLDVTKSFHPGTSLEAYLFLGASWGRLEVFTPLDVKICPKPFFAGMCFSR